MVDKKIALVTGGNRGLGLETSRRLAELGHHVLIGSRDLEKGRQAAEALVESGLAAEAVRLDMADPTTFPPLVADIESQFGRLDVLVNNAGVQLDGEEEWSVNTTLRLTTDRLRQTFDVNFFGLVELTQALVPLIRQSGAGRIVNVSSILGSLSLHADPASPVAQTKLFGYNASKAALNAFTIHLADALRETPIKVNSAHPGWVRTEMGGSSAMLDVREGVETAVALATLPAEGPTGAFLHAGETLPW